MKTCECCGQKIRIEYDFVPNESHARALEHMAKHQERWCEWRELQMMGINTTFAQLKKYGLIERKAKDDPKKTHSGVWRLTFRGVEFVHGRILISERITKKVGSDEFSFSFKQISFKDIAGHQFDARTDLKPVNIGQVVNAKPILVQRSFAELLKGVPKK